MDKKQATPNPRTPLTTFSSRSSTATKRDSLTAELERDSPLASAKRHQRTQVFTSSIAHANLERQLVSVQTTKAELEAKLRDRELQIERLERDRRWLADREKQEREEREKERVEFEEEKRKTEEDLRTLRTSLSTLREEHADLVDTHSSLAHTLSHSTASQQSLLNTLTNQTSLLQTSLTQAEQLAEERLRVIAEVQTQLDDLTLQKESTAKRRDEEESMHVVREELQRQAGYLRELERANAKLTGELNILRERHTSIEVLKEEKRELEQKVAVMDGLREKVVRLEGEVEAGRRQRESWVSVDDPATSSTPVPLTQTFSGLRLTHARLLEEHGATTALLRTRDAELAALAARESEWRQQVEGLEFDVRDLRDKVERKEGRVRLVEREMGFLQALVASYTSEQSMQRQRLSTSPEPPDLQERERDGQAAERVAGLESLLREYKATNELLDRQLDEAFGGGVGASSSSSSSFGKSQNWKGRSRQDVLNALEAERRRTDELSEMLSTSQAQTATLTAQITTLEKEVEGLEQTLYDLRGEIAGGRHVPPGVRVLSLRENPESEWAAGRREVVERVKGENEALLKRVAELEEMVGEERERGTGGEGGRKEGREGLVPRESWELVYKEKLELEDVVKQKEKRLLRLKQIFESKGAEFREAIASILGVKLAFFTNGNVRVTSVYDLTTSFVFQPTKGGASHLHQDGGTSARMQLVAQGEGGPQDLPSLMEYWIGKEECIPGFMASVTLECYDTAKRSGTIAM